MRLREFAPYQPTVANSHHDEPMSATGKEIIQTTAKKELAKEATVSALEITAELIEADLTLLMPEMAGEMLPGAQQLIALYLIGKNVAKQQWTAAAASAASAVPYAGIPALALEMATELYSKYYIKEHSHKPADPTIDAVNDPIGTNRRMKHLTQEVTAALKKFTEQGLARTKQRMDPNSPNSMARTTARLAPHSAGPVFK
jgi:hypothetical protein